MGKFFDHDQEDLKHPTFIYDRKGRATVKLERQMIEAAVRPLLDLTQRLLRKSVATTLGETEYLFFNHNLIMEEGFVKDHYLQIVLVHNGPDMGKSGPVAQISLIAPGYVRWFINHKDEGVYKTIIDKPDEFYVAFRKAVMAIFGQYREMS